jgi:uncharacterized protein (DUF362 family)
MYPCQTRRHFLKSAAISSAWLAVPKGARAAGPAPATPVSVAKCDNYGPDLVPTLDRMFDKIGGLGRLVKGKTVAMKINLTGAPSYRVGYLPCEDTHYTHPRVIGAVCYLMSRAGARRIRLLESPWATADAVEEYILQANWDPLDILNSAPNVEFENTNFLGNSKKYSRVNVPYGGLMFPGFDLNHSYTDCDVFVSLAKMKEHATAGITLSMKNCFGITPATIYGTGAGVDEPSILPRGGRTIVHGGTRQPSKSAPGELHPDSPREDTYRVPRTIVDLVSARPIDLAVIDGIRTMTGGEGPWIREKLTGVQPGVLVAGTNCVNIDAVSMAIMGFDPMADRGTLPFENCDSTLRLAEDVGLGTRDLKRIEVRGTPVKDVLFDFATIRRNRRATATGRAAMKIG